MAAKAESRRREAIAAEFGHLRVEEPWRFDADHPKWVDVCRVCCEWRPYNPDALWLGYGWHQICGWPCKFDHDHHDGEVWFAEPLIGVNAEPST